MEELMKQYEQMGISRKVYALGEKTLASLADRFAEIDKTLEYFIGRMKEHKKIGVAYVSTAAALSDVQKEKVNARLLETTDFETIEMNYTVDESLLGGMVIRIGDRVVDTSIKNKLRELSKQLSALQVG